MCLSIPPPMMKEQEIKLSIVLMRSLHRMVEFSKNSDFFTAVRIAAALINTPERFPIAFHSRRTDVPQGPETAHRPLALFRGPIVKKWQNDQTRIFAAIAPRLSLMDQEWEEIAALRAIVSCLAEFVVVQQPEHGGLFLLRCRHRANEGKEPEAAHVFSPAVFEQEPEQINLLVATLEILGAGKDRPQVGMGTPGWRRCSCIKRKHKIQGAIFLA